MQSQTVELAQNSWSQRIYLFTHHLSIIFKVTRHELPQNGKEELAGKKESVGHEAYVSIVYVICICHVLGRINGMRVSPYIELFIPMNV